MPSILLLVLYLCLLLGLLLPSLGFEAEEEADEKEDAQNRVTTSIKWTRHILQSSFLPDGVLTLQCATE